MTINMGGTDDLFSLTCAWVFMACVVTALVLFAATAVLFVADMVRGRI